MKLMPRNGCIFSCGWPPPAGVIAWGCMEAVGAPAPYGNTVSTLGVASTFGLKLDGEWSNGADAYPSGNGSQGGDFRFRLNVLGADATRDGRVNSLDLSAVKQRLNTASTDVGRTLYSAFVDVNGDGRINSLDLSLVKQRLNRALPIAEPTGTLFSVRRLDDWGVTDELLA